jgi:hypothetical protein
MEMQYFAASLKKEALATLIEKVASTSNWTLL